MSKPDWECKIRQERKGEEYHVLIIKYQDHINIRYLDTEGTSNFLNKDLQYKLENKQTGKIYDLSSFSNVTNGSVIYSKQGVHRTHYGVERMFLVSNSEWTEFIQYVRTTDKSTWNGEHGLTKDWELDGDTCYDQTILDAGKTKVKSAFMLDGPGVNLPPDEDLIKKLILKVHGVPINQLIRSEFETFIWCEGKIYGYATWGVEVLAVITKDSYTVKAVNQIPVLWHDDPSASQNYADAVLRPGRSQSPKFKCCE